MASSFRFLHASDFHLDQPPGGLTELPEGLVDPLIDASYRGVDRVVDIAIQERVDFMVLSGDIIHFPTASIRATEFLAAQFDRLHEAKIATYWLGGNLERGLSPPDDFRMPSSIHRLGSSRVQILEVKKNKKTIAYVVGQSSGSHSLANLEEMRVPRDGRFFVGLWYCQGEHELNRDQLDDLGIDYWAFGGGHSRKELSTMIPAHFCGTPQGRLPAESGPHGCLLVDVHGETATTQFIETDSIRYHQQRVEVREGDDRHQVIARIRSLADQLQAETQGQRHLLVTWEIVDNGPLGRALRRIDGSSQFLAEIQSQVDRASARHVWTIGVKSVRAHIPTSYYDEDSILGDFLREVRALDQRQDAMLDLHTYLPDTPEASRLLETLHLNSPLVRQQLLHDVATLGVDLLSGDQP